MRYPASYDLHLHTCWSYDATADPCGYFERGRELGVKCIAITEHYNLDSLEEIGSLQSSYPDVKIIAGVELTVSTSIGAVDLLCYGVPVSPRGKLAEILGEYRSWAVAEGRAKSEGMRALGFPFDDGVRRKLLQTYRPERVLRRQGLTRMRRSLERSHFMANGYIQSESEYRGLCEKLHNVVPAPAYPSVRGVVDAVKEAGGLVVIAHPATYFLGCDGFRMDLLREECGLDGIECAHPRIARELTPKYRSYCRQHDLISTAGSDCHTNESLSGQPLTEGDTSRSFFASHCGESAWLDEFLERLLSRSVNETVASSRACSERSKMSSFLPFYENEH